MKTGVSLCVDARGLRCSGIGRYLREILAVIFRDGRFVQVQLLGSTRDLRAFADDCESHQSLNLVFRDFPLGFYTVASQLAWARLRAGGVGRDGVTFFPHYDTPLVGLPARSVVTVQDLTHFRLPGAFPVWRRAPARLLLYRGAGSAARLIVTSESTRRDLAEYLPHCVDRTDVIPLGVSSFFTGAASHEVRSPMPEGVSRPYILCVGNLKPHKNLSAAVETLSQLAHSDDELRLVLAGRPFAGTRELFALAERRGVAGRVVSLPAPTDRELRALYSNAELLLFPSWYEGFGLPVVEAMAAGCPVVASNRASIPEVAGGAAVLVKPDDIEEMSTAVLRLRSNASHRQELVRRGRLRAAQLTWEEAGKRTADLLYKVACGGADPREPRMVDA